MFKDLSTQSILEPGSLWLLPCTYLSIVAQIEHFCQYFLCLFLWLASFGVIYRGEILVVFVGKCVVVTLL